MDRIAAFDTLYTNNHVQICKLILPLLPKDKQYYLAIFIKFLELQHTIKYGQKLQIETTTPNDSKPNYQNLCKEALPYCTAEEENLVKMILNLLNAMDTFESLKPFMDLLGQFNDSPLGDLSSMTDLFQGNVNLDFLNNLKDMMPGTGTDFFNQEHHADEPTSDYKNKEQVI